MPDGTARYFRRTAVVRPAGPCKPALARSLGSVMRLLGVLALAAPVMIGILLLCRPGYHRVLGRSRAPVRRGCAIMAITLGVSLDRRPGRWLIIAHPVRAPGQGRRADRRRRLHGRGPDPRRRPRGPPRRSRSTASPTSLADTHDRATIDRLTGVANRQALLADAVRRGRARDALRAPAVRRLRRHRPLQGGQRHVRPRAPATSSCAAWPRRSPRTCARATSSAATAARNSCSS